MLVFLAEIEDGINLLLLEAKANSHSIKMQKRNIGRPMDLDILWVENQHKTALLWVGHQWLKAIS